MRRFLHANSLAILAAGALGLGGATAAVSPRLPIRSGQYPSDADAPQVGGCSEGPDVVDLVRKIYWTC